MFHITIQHPVEGEAPVVLETEDRSLARSVAQLAKENGLDYEVSTEVAPRVVKFKGL